MIPADWITRAHAVRIEDEIERRRIKLVGRIDRCGACPQCGGRDRFSINVRKQCFNCRGCDANGDVIDLVRFLDGCDFHVAIAALIGKRANGYEPRPPVKTAGHAASDRAEGDKARWLWRQSQPITGTIGEVYLREPRGYSGEIPPTLGFLPARGQHPPALIAAFGIATEPECGLLAIADADVRAVQLVKLKPDGSGKADVNPRKITLGAARGSPIVCAPPNDLLGLALTEGLEDALSIHEATGLGVWASGGATFMPALADAVPSYIDCVDVFGDDDDAGRRGATELGARLKARGFEVIVKFLRAGSSA
jgi:phage/plasmid primase-like uncharacterized protein